MNWNNTNNNKNQENIYNSEHLGLPLIRTASKGGEGDAYKNDLQNE